MMIILVPQACDIPSASNSNFAHLETYKRRESNKGPLSVKRRGKTDTNASTSKTKKNGVKVFTNTAGSTDNEEFFCQGLQ